MGIFDLFKSKKENGFFKGLNRDSANDKSKNPNLLILSNLLRSIDKTSLNTYVEEKKDTLIQINHPYIFYVIGEKYLIDKEYEKAKPFLLKAIFYGLVNPCTVFDNGWVDSIGTSISYLVSDYKCSKEDKSYTIEYKLFKLGYLYLSRCIELHPKDSYDSHYNRGRLLDKANPYTFQQFALEINQSGISTNKDPMIIYDFYRSATIDGTSKQHAYEYAKQIHRSLGDQRIAGKDADEYTLAEIGIVGANRHNLFYELVLKQYNEGKLNINDNDFINAYI
jgi:hypothetical protein